MFNALRWLTVLVAPGLGYLVAFAGAAVLSEQLTRLCPPHLLVSGMCTAPWYPTAELAAISVAVGTGALLFVLLPTLVAPNNKPVVATSAFVLGTVATTWFTWQVGLSFLAPFLSALGVGGVTALTLTRRAANAA
jgi:hypothetical protein